MSCIPICLKTCNNDNMPEIKPHLYNHITDESGQNTPNGWVFTSQNIQRFVRQRECVAKVNMSAQCMERKNKRAKSWRRQLVINKKVSLLNYIPLRAPLMWIYFGKKVIWFWIKRNNQVQNVGCFFVNHIGSWSYKSMTKR